MNGSRASGAAVAGNEVSQADRPVLRVLVAPDSYGGSLTAVEAAGAIAAGWTRSRPRDLFTIAPQSDGGPGFVSVLAGRLGELRCLRVSGPLDAAVDAQWVFDAGTATAYLGCAQACGLALLGGPPTPQTALAAHSRGVGQLIEAALQAGVTRIVVGLGGSASTDGGQGMVAQLGGLDTGRRAAGGGRADRRLGCRLPAAGTVGRRQGVRAAERCRPGHRRRTRAASRNVGR